MNNRKKKTYQHTQEHDIKTTTFDTQEVGSFSIQEIVNPGVIMLKACQKGNIERVKEMLAQGTDPNVTDLADNTGISFAATNGHLDIVKLLLEHGADPNAGLGDDLNTPLHAAAWKQYNEIVDALIAAGAKLDVMNKDHVTPIMYAISANNIITVEKLLLAGASIEVEGQAAKSIDIAKAKKYPDLVNLIALHMALQELKQKDPVFNSMYATVRNETRAGAQFKIFALKEKPVDGKVPENVKTYQFKFPQA